MTIGIVGALGDWGTRTWEMNQLLAHIKVSEDAMGTTKDTIGAIEIPSDATAEQKAEATDKLKAASAQGADEVAHAGDGVAALTFLPWHSEIIHAQAAYLAHNAAWVDYLERGSKEPVSLFGDDNRIEPTWVNAQRAVAAGIPIPALPLIQSAYDSLFTDDQPDDQSGGGGVAA
ncbi:MAG: hypothetical protein U0R64_08520 [Candidatus Nanopelagicales bacterium]